METLLRRIYAGQKYRHVYTQVSVQARIRVRKHVVHYTFKHISTIIKLSSDVT